jgi:uncharacterized protein
MELIDAVESPRTGDRPRADRDTSRLMGSRCAECRASVWPARAVCHRCGSPDVRAEAFEPTGTLLTYTTVHVPRPGLTVPYLLGQIRVDGEGPVVFGHVRDLPDNASVPLPVRVYLSPEEGAIPWYWFAPV